MAPTLLRLSNHENYFDSVSSLSKLQDIVHVDICMQEKKVSYQDKNKNRSKMAKRNERKRLYLQTEKSDLTP